MILPVVVVGLGPMRQAVSTAFIWMIGVTLFGLIFEAAPSCPPRADRFMPKAMQHGTLHAHGHPEPADEMAVAMSELPKPSRFPACMVGPDLSPAIALIAGEGRQAPLLGAVAVFTGE